MPDQSSLLPAHGDYHSNQLLEIDGGLAVIDFDEMCAARRGARPGELRRAPCQRRGGRHDGRLGGARRPRAGYGGRPHALAWYLSTSILRRSPFPFRFMEPNWPLRIERMVTDAEEALHL